MRIIIECDTEDQLIKAHDLKIAIESRIFPMCPVVVDVPAEC